MPSLFSSSFYDLDICEQSRLCVFQHLPHYEFADFPNAKIKVRYFGRYAIEVLLSSSHVIRTRGHVTSPCSITSNVDFDHLVKITPASFFFFIIAIISLMWQTHCGILRQLCPGEPRLT